MDLVKVIEMFPTQEDCMAYLERIRWQGSPECPHCESTQVKRRNESDTGRIGRYNCHDCKSTFKVTGDKDRTSEVVSGNMFDGQCQEKPIESSTRTGSWTSTEGNMADDDVYSSRNGKGKRHLRRDRRGR